MSRDRWIVGRATFTMLKSNWRTNCAVQIRAITRPTDPAPAAPWVEGVVFERVTTQTRGQWSWGGDRRQFGTPPFECAHKPALLLGYHSNRQGWPSV